jgi:hypothetical protein
MIQPRWGWILFKVRRGNPKLQDATALRLEKEINSPRVAAKARQPWAAGCNRVAVGKRNAFTQGSRQSAATLGYGMQPQRG